MNASRRFLAGGIAATAAVGMLASPAAAVPAQHPKAAVPATRASDVTNAIEAQRVDRVPTPKLKWKACYQRAECATATLPLDYDEPSGATVKIALLRIKATNQQKKIGSLFLNPGGPGGSGVAIALAAPSFASAEVLERFDIVGFDPRGIGDSDQVRCFKSTAEQMGSLAGQDVAFPYTKDEESEYIAAAKSFGKACSSTGKPLSGAMSTAEVARDMDVLRRAVGDKKLTYLGFSYGSALGAYYANMFPDRFRALTIDGVINPVSWAGTPKTKEVILDERLRSADGAYRALREIFARCDAAGAAACALAGHAAEDFELVASRLKAKPVEYREPLTGEPTVVTYAAFVSYTLGVLYDVSGYQSIEEVVADLLVLTDPNTPANTARKASASRDLARRVTELRARAAADESYDNGLEASSGVMCTDALHPKDAAGWPTKTAAADQRAPYFGRAWAWGTVACASKTWTVRDEDAYRGPFNRRTSAPVLVVGSYWDPATNYDDAVSTAALMPNSRLLSSDNWGHTAYGTSACATRAVEAYLLNGTLPAAGTVCVGDVQPYAPSAQARRAADTARTERPASTVDEVAEQPLPAPGEPKLLPPVVSRVPGLPLA